MVSSDVISQILAVFKGRSKQYNVGSFISNDNGTSFYLSSKRGTTPVQIRLSNHGTYLKTWVDRTHLEDSRERLIDPSHCINISVIFIDEGQNITKDCPSQQDCEGCLIQPCIPQTFEGQNELGHPFSVKQYCYQSKFIRQKYINGIVKAIFEAIITGEYVDPLASLKRAAKPKTLSSKQGITKESKINKNMKKNVVKINEQQLKKIVAESVKMMLKEYAWPSAPTFKELEKVLDKIRGILGKFTDNIPQEHSAEFMKLAGREWNDLWDSFTSIWETVWRINHPHGLSDGDLTSDDLS